MSETTKLSYDGPTIDLSQIDTVDLSPPDVAKDTNNQYDDNDPVVIDMEPFERQLLEQHFAELPVGDGINYSELVSNLRDEVGDGLLSDVLRKTLGGISSSESIAQFSRLTEDQKQKILDLATVAASEKAYLGSTDPQKNILSAYKNALDRGGDISVYADASNEEITTQTKNVIFFGGTGVKVSKTINSSTGEITGFEVISTS